MAIDDETLAAAKAALLAALAGPKRVRGDAGEVEAHSIRELLQAFDQAEEAVAVERPSRGLRFTKLIPPGNA